MRLAALNSTLALLGSRAQHRCCSRCGLSTRVCECPATPARAPFTSSHRREGMGAAADTVTRGVRSGFGMMTPESCARPDPTDCPDRSHAAGAVAADLNPPQHDRHGFTDTDHPFHGSM